MTMDNKKTMVDFRAFLATFAPEYPVKKGYVAALILEGKKKVVLGRVQKKIAALVPIVPDKHIWHKALEANLLTFKKHFKKLIKGLNKQWDKLVELCNEIFVVKFKELLVVVSFPPPQPSALALPSEPPVSDAPSTSYVSAGSNRQRLRNECERCANMQRMYRSTFAELRQKLREQSRRHTLEMEKYASIRGAHKIIKMKDASRLKWRAKYYHLHERSNLDARKVDRLQQELEILKKYCGDLTANLKEKDHTIEDLQTQLQKAPYKFAKDIVVVSRKVGPKGIAGRAGLHNGDAVLQICGTDVSHATQQEAKNELMRAGNEVDLFVVRGAVNISDPAVKAACGVGQSNKRVELDEGSINPHMNEGSSFRNVTPKTYKILEQQLGSSEQPVSALSRQPVQEMQPVHAQSAEPKPSSIFDRNRTDRSDYLVAQGQTIQKTYGEQ